MSRWFSFVLGGAAVLAAGVSMASSPVKAQEKEKDVRIVKIIGGGPRLGAMIEEVDPPARGASVKEVQEGTPAAKAGLKAGDVIVKFDGREYGGPRSSGASWRRPRPAAPWRSRWLEARPGRR